MVTALLLGRRRYEAGIPLAANCSAVISAACHTKDRFADREAASLPLQWGVTHSEGEVGHLRLFDRGSYIPRGNPSLRWNLMGRFVDPTLMGHCLSR